MAAGLMAFVTFFKSQMVSRAIGRRERARSEQKAWLAVRKEVLSRDGYKCRVCGIGDSQLDVHHVKARSAGGDDVTSNLIAVCRICHSELTLHRLWSKGENANKPMRFERVR
jgi:5-methylcytosine-specific restriction endonuclease McrA